VPQETPALAAACSSCVYFTQTSLRLLLSVLICDSHCSTSLLTIIFSKLTVGGAEFCQVVAVPICNDSTKAGDGCVTRKEHPHLCTACACSNKRLVHTSKHHLPTKQTLH
jgi:hypothetical protein